MDSQEAPAAKRTKLEERLWEKQNNNFLSKVYESLYLDEKTADVHFICGAEGKRIPGHKCILSKSSPYFDALFYGPNAKECDKDYSKWSPDAFKDFLKLCYLDKVAIAPNNIIEVMKLAHESLMFESLKLCGDLWADNMTTDDVCCAYHLAINFEMDEFKEFCERKISFHADVVFETPHFLSCDFVVMDHILGLNTLCCDEKAVLQASLNWASKAYERDDLNLQKYLKDSLYKVRYNSITLKQWCEIIDSKGGLFTDVKDYVDFIRLIAGASHSKTGPFNQSPRSSKFTWIESRTVTWNCFNRLDLCNETVEHGTTLSMTLRSSRPVLLGGFYWAPIESSDNSSKTAVKIKQGLSIGSIHIAYIEMKSTSEAYLDLTKNPIILRPKSEYKIYFEFSGCERYIYYSSKIDKKIELDNETTIEIAEAGYNIVRGFKFNLL